MNGKLKFIQNRSRKSELESESEEGENDEENDFKMENPDTSEFHGIAHNDEKAMFPPPFVLCASPLT